MSKIGRELIRVRVISIAPNALDRKSTIDHVDRLIGRAGGAYLCIATVHMVMEAYDNPAYAKRVNSADLIVTDGMPLTWMQRLQGYKSAERIRGTDLMISLFSYAERNGKTVGFYGGSQDVLKSINKRIFAEYPDLRVVYAESPPFRSINVEEDAKFTFEINSAGPDILFVGLGCPKQENWMAAHRDRLSSVMLGVGAAFDFYAGNVLECPKWIGNLGLEWLFRLMQEPKRLWKRYLILNPRFVALAILQLTGLKKFGD